MEKRIESRKKVGVCVRKSERERERERKRDVFCHLALFIDVGQILEYTSIAQLTWSAKDAFLISSFCVCNKYGIATEINRTSDLKKKKFLYLFMFKIMSRLCLKGC